MHVCVDDCTRLAYVEVLDDERTPSVCARLKRATAWFGARGDTVQRLITDNGPAYRSTAHREVCRLPKIKHPFTEPYRPHTNSKAKRFIRTLTNGWAHGAIYQNSHHRPTALAAWLDHYNNQRPHRDLNRSTPAQRLTQTEQPHPTPTPKAPNARDA